MVRKVAVGFLWKSTCVMLLSKPHDAKYNADAAIRRRDAAMHCIERRVLLQA